MKKCLVFAGVLGLAAVAHAQGSVTLYGVIDTGFNYVKATLKKVNAVGRSIVKCG